ncbi:MAG: hypothetical protein ACPF8T_05435 [Litorivicinaceae bacterium]
MMNILHHWALMAANALTLMGLMITLYEQGWQSYHWSFFVLVPIWVCLIRELYLTDWDDHQTDP